MLSLTLVLALEKPVAWSFPAYWMLLGLFLSLYLLSNVFRLSKYSILRCQDIGEGVFSVLIVQPEQLSTMAGHLPRLARLINQDQWFRKRITRVHIDEAHFIFTAGCGLYSLPAFHPAWGKLGELPVKLSKGVVFQALSGTQPKHIKKVIIESLLLDEENLCHIKLSSNRPNTVYATHPIVGNLSDLCNLDFLIPDPYPADFQLPKTIIFHDNIDECATASAYVNDRLPKVLRSKGIVKHYHGGMSKQYLTKVYEEFSKPDSSCRILHATEGHQWILGNMMIGYDTCNRLWPTTWISAIIVKSYEQYHNVIESQMTDLQMKWSRYNLLMRLTRFVEIVGCCNKLECLRSKYQDVARMATHCEWSVTSWYRCISKSWICYGLVYTSL